MVSQKGVCRVKEMMVKLNVWSKLTFMIGLHGQIDSIVVGILYVE